jgi:hypothetical protein
MKRMLKAGAIEPPPQIQRSWTPHRADNAVDCFGSSTTELSFC